LAAEGTGGKARLRTALLVVIGLLYVVSIPWYRESGAEPAIVFGFPDWVAVSIGCYVAIAILNSIAWFLTEVSDPDPNEPPESPEPGGAREPRALDLRT